MCVNLNTGLNVIFLMVSDDVSFIENRHSSCPLQEGEWPDQGERQTPGDGGAGHSPVQGELSPPHPRRQVVNIRVHVSDRGSYL